MTPNVRRSRRLFVVALVLTSYVVPTPALAFSVPNHVMITEAALRQIRTCAVKYPNRWSELDAIDGYGGVISACNMKQDDVERKVRVWHFFGSDRTLKVSGLVNKVLKG